MGDTQASDTPKKKWQVLEALAQKRFQPLKTAESKLLFAGTRGEFAFCGPSQNDDHPENDPSHADESWGSDREIRAELLRWLLVDAEASRCIDLRGITIHAAKITGVLNLIDSKLPFALFLVHCRLSDDAYLTDAKAQTLSFAGSRLHSLSADGVNAEGNIFLRGNFVAEGEVRLVGAQIGSDLDCSGATFKNGLAFDRSVVKGGVFLNQGFTAEGGVRLIGAQIGSDLDCSGATFRSGLAVDSGVIKGGVFLNQGFTAEGGVHLYGAQIDGDLVCSGATFKSGLNIERSVVQGGVFLNHGFTADAEVGLVGAQIDGLFCEGGIFKNPKGKAISADRLLVKGGIFFIEGFVAEGKVILAAAHIGADLDCVGATVRNMALNQARIAGTFWWTGISQAKSCALDLSDASVTTIYDDESSWPVAGNLLIDGFAYQRMEGPSTKVDDRLRWIGLQRPFASQPYRQLASVLADLGDRDGAHRVLFEMERLRRTTVESTTFAKSSNLILEASIGYGYYPERAIFPLIGLTALGWILYRRSYLARTMAPTDKEAYEAFKEHGEAPPYYRRFHPLIYSLENCIPLVRLGQADRWEPDSAEQPKKRLTVIAIGRVAWLRGVWRFSVDAVDRLAERPAFLQRFVWAQVLLGWILATLFVVGVTGLVR